jgi:hypothetical protein
MRGAILWRANKSWFGTFPHKVAPKAYWAKRTGSRTNRVGSKWHAPKPKPKEEMRAWLTFNFQDGASSPLHDQKPSIKLV